MKAQTDDVTDEHVARALADLDVQVADLPQLPQEQSSGASARLYDDVARLRQRLSVQVVFTDAVRVGFRLLNGFALDDGRVIDQAAIASGRQQASGRPDRDVAERVLAYLNTSMAVPGGVDDLVLAEVVRQLRPLRREGMGQRALRKQATLLGIVPSDAELLAAALVEENGPVEIDDGQPTASPLWSSRSATAGRGKPPTTSEPAVRRRPEPVGHGPLVSPSITPQGRETTPHSPTIMAPEVTVRSGRPGHLTAAWSTVPGAQIVLRRAAHPPHERSTTIVNEGVVAAHGKNEPTAGAVPAGDGWMSMDIPLPEGAEYLTVYAVLPEMGVVGNTVALMEAEPVRELEVQRLGRQALLGWGWPKGSVAALVTWTIAGQSESGAELRCTIRDLDRGLRINVGHGEVTFKVSAVYGYHDNETVSPASECQLAAMGVPVRYEIRPRGWRQLRPGRRRCSVQITAEESCVLPDILIVEGHAERRPTSPDGGQTVHRLPGRRVPAGAPVTIRVNLSNQRPSWLVCFIDPSAWSEADKIHMEHPPESELRRR